MCITNVRLGICRNRHLAPNFVPVVLILVLLVEVVESQLQRGGLIELFDTLHARPPPLRERHILLHRPDVLHRSLEEDALGLTHRELLPRQVVALAEEVVIIELGLGLPIAEVHGERFVIEVFLYIISHRTSLWRLSL